MVVLRNKRKLRLDPRAIVRRVQVVAIAAGRLSEFRG